MSEPFLYCNSGRKGFIVMKYQKLPVVLAGVLYGCAPDSTDAMITRYLMEHMEDADISISQIAQDCHVGMATVSRYVRNIGFESFSALRECMKKEEETFETVDDRNTVETIVQSHSDALSICLKSIDLNQVELLCRQIESAEHVFLAGLLKGESAAMCLCADLCSLGKLCHTTVSLNNQMKQIMESSKDDLIIVFSATMSYFEYSDIRRIRHLLENRNIWMIGNGTKPDFIRHAITYESGDIPLSHPVQLVAAAELIAQKYAEICR